MGELEEEAGELASMAAELLRWEQAMSGPQWVHVDSPIGTRSTERTPTETRDRDVRPPPSEPAASAEDRRKRLATLAEGAAACTACALHRGRTKSVFSRGAPEAELVFVGEGPGYHEDQSGAPFVGAAGQLLDKMIGAMGLSPEQVYICNVVKCRPPENRTPLPDEAGACAQWLVPQIEAVAPKVIVALGRCASENLGCVEPGGRGWRGAWKSYRGIPVMSTYHPAFLLRSPDMKRPVWEDLQKVMARLGLAGRAR